MENDNTANPALAAPPSGNMPVIVLSGLLVLLVGAIFGYFVYPVVNKPNPPEAVPETQTEAKAEPISASENTFCELYGTFQVTLNDLLEKYVTGPGETFRDIARDKLGDETKAAELADANPGLKSYGIDDELRMQLSLNIPNVKYKEEGVTSYAKTRGNISFNQNKPMFGVNAPNAGTGPFIIGEKIRSDLDKIKGGDCVEVVYGSRGFDPQKIVFEVKAQQKK